ncbi:DUF4435 domain-containing protein [Acinetobacter sp. WCHAc010034]|uniref:DUF4435 domain-containing protein n=1 Tax=Acinetobacter sp. WCHAc010034 TaxID=1879049 RepID=UPI00083A4962|nr:DUF4435 domain-containing protein [Acinetobacter sp. WCHAc010034]
MSDFQSFLTNGKFIGAYNASKEGSKDSAQKGLVYIEDDSDQVFWEKFINFHFPNQYNVQASIKDRPSERGKRALERLYEGANKKVLIAVDSDYDIICPRINPEYSQFLINNRFIIHTYGFSRESALLDKKNLNLFFNSIKHTIQHNVDIESFLNKFSPIAFKGLVFFSNELNSGNTQGFIESDFHNCFNILGKKIVKDDLTLDENLLEIIENNLCSYFNQLQYNDEKITQAECYLQTLNINPDNAYRYISGHTVYDLIFKIHEQLIDILYRKEVDKIKENFSGKAIGERISQLNSLFTKQFPLEAFCHSYPINQDDEIHKEIKNKVASIS